MWEFLWCYNPSKIIKYCILHDVTFTVSALTAICDNKPIISIFRIFLRKVIGSSFWCKFISFASCARAYETWKQCQWIMRTLTCKLKIWGENWLCLRPYLKAFPVLNVVETCREYLLTIDLGIVEFIKKFIERFLEKCEIFRYGPNYVQKLYQKELNAS